MEGGRDTRGKVYGVGALKLALALLFPGSVDIASQTVGQQENGSRRLRLSTGTGTRTRTALGLRSRSRSSSPASRGVAHVKGMPFSAGQQGSMEQSCQFTGLLNTCTV